MVSLKNFLQIYDISKSMIFKRPRVILANLTNKCNADCFFCHADKSVMKELSLDEWRTLLDQLDSWLGTFFIDFSGGEPLLHKNWQEILSYSQEKGFLTSLSTNGYLVNKNIADKIMNLNISSVYISLYGLENIHNLLVQGNFYEKLVAGVSNLLEARKKSSSRTKIIARVILHDKNILETKKLINRIMKLGFDAIVFRPLAVADSLMGLYSKKDIWPKESKKLKHAIQEIKNSKRQGTLILNSYKNLDLIHDYYFKDIELSHSRKGHCELPFKIMRISADGIINSCCTTLGCYDKGIKDLFYEKSLALKILSRDCEKQGLMGSTETTSIGEKTHKAREIFFN